MASGRDPSDVLPGTSVSRTFLAFLGPLLHDLPDDRATRDSLLKIGVLVWNATGLEACRGEGKWLAMARARLVGRPEAALIEQLIERKRAEFAEHVWLVGDCGFFERDGELRLRVEARSVEPDPAHGASTPPTPEA